MTEQTSLDDIMSARGQSVPEATPTPEPAAPAEGTTSRDDKGRFAAKAEPAAAPVPAAPQAAPTPESVEQQPNGFVPIKALDAERGKRKELEDRYEKDMQELRAQLARLSTPQKPAEPPAPPPTLWDAPDEFIASQLTPVQQQMADMREFVSENMAIQAHGAETVEAAKKAAEQIARTPEGQQMISRLLQSRHPYDDLVKWHKSQSILSEIGTDPEAYKQKIIQEYLAQQQPTPQAQPQAPQAAAPVMPTSFAAAPTSGPRGGPEYGGPRALSDIMKR